LPIAKYFQNAKEIVEEVKEMIKENAEEVTNDIVEAAKEALKAEETKTPTTDGEEKKKVKKSFSLRKKLSFLRKEKKVKEDKHKNGDVGTPEVRPIELPFLLLPPAQFQFQSLILIPIFLGPYYKYISDFGIKSQSTYILNVIKYTK
jgi:hypothetical protein